MITVVICTWNRSSLLQQTLERMRTVRVPSSCDWELLIVNNNCTDETDAVAMQFAEELPIRIVHESTAGLSQARNRALVEARFDWLIFTDDDVLVDRDWLAAYFSAISSVGESIAFLGGEVRPWFEVPPSKALAEGIPTTAKGFCGVELPDTLAIVQEDDRIPVGANFSICRSRVSGLRFDPKLGVVGGKRLSSEERQYMLQLLRNKKQGRWLEGAGVEHYVPKERLALKYLVPHIFNLGRTSVMVNGVPDGRAVGRVPLWCVREAITSSFLIPVLFATCRKALVYREISRVSSRVGIVWECVRFSGRRARERSSLPSSEC